MSRLRKRELAVGLVFIAPWVIGFLWFTAYPMLSSLYYSFTNYDLLERPVWIGLGNYIQAVHDPQFWIALVNTVEYALMSVVPGTVFALLLALLLMHKVPGLSVFRTIYFIPLALPLVATSVVWQTILDPQFGYLNAILHAIGVAHPPGWLASPAWSKPAFAVMSFWSVGTATIIYLAALQGVPQHLLEAATIDGAGPVRRFWHVTVPSISPAILFNLVLSLIATFQFFTQPYVLLKGSGGPLQSALFYVPYMWEQAFSNFRMGYASAMAWVLFIIIFACTALVLRFSRNRVYYEEG